MSSHSVAVGRYVKIGNTVTAHANVNGVVSGSGSMTVSGLPFHQIQLLICNNQLL